MSELISGKEALESILDGIDIQYLNNFNQWDDAAIAISVMDFLDCKFKFRLKPRTITINGIEVPAPFKPEKHKSCYLLHDLYECGYIKTSWNFDYYVRPAWRTEEEIKQVVSALRSIFNEG